MKTALIIPKGRKVLFILLTCCFAAWGLANNMTDTLLAAFKRIQSLSDLQTSLIQVSFYGAYFCLALPAAIMIRRFSYKTGVLLGLFFFVLGGLLFFPASMTMQYAHFLAALFILASGLSILETAANPYIYVMGDPRTATQRLNLAASFNPLGAITGVLLSKVFILSKLQDLNAATRAELLPEELVEIQSGELTAVMTPYVGVSIVLIILLIFLSIAKFEKGFDERVSVIADDGLRSALRRLAQNKHYLAGVVAQFFYIGAQIGVWSFTIQYIMAELGHNENRASNYYIAALIVYAISRFVCTGLMSFFRPSLVLLGTGLLGCFLTSITLLVGGFIGGIALVFISGCMSLMFPTIYGVGLRDVGKDTKIAGSGMIMAIVGGAILTALQARVSDLTGVIRYSFVVPLICFIVVSLYAWVSYKGKRDFF